MDIIKAVEADYLKEQTAPLLIGDYVKVHFKVKEGTRERIQIFEGTVIGNLLMQAMALGAFDSLSGLRACVAESFPTETFLPEGEAKAWDEAYARLLALGK